MDYLPLTMKWISSSLPFDMFLLLIVASFITSFINATFGIGGGVLMLAILLLVLPAEVVIPVHAMIQLTSNIGRTWAFKSHIEYRIVQPFIPGCLAGAVIAAFFVINLPGWALESIIGLFIFWTLVSEKQNKTSANIKNYFAVGFGTSVVSSFIGATGPLVATFLYAEKMERQDYIGTHGACMTVQHLLKLIAFSVTGFVLVTWLPLITLLTVAGLAGTMTGKKILFGMSEIKFRKVFRIVLSLFCIKILFTATASAASEFGSLQQPHLLIGELTAQLNSIQDSKWAYRLLPINSIPPR